MKSSHMRIVQMVCALSLMLALGGGALAAQEEVSKDLQKGRKSLPPGQQSQTPPNWVIADYHSETPGNVFYNNQTVNLSLTLAARDASKPLTIRGGSWRIKEIEDQPGWPQRADRRLVESNVACGEGTIAPQAGAKVPVTIAWKPTRLGAFGIYLKLDDGSGASEEMVWGFAVVYPPAVGSKPDSPVVFHLGGNDIPRLAAAHQRLGVKWIRWETGWGNCEPRPGEWTWDTYDAWVKAAADNGLYILAIMGHAPGWASPKIGDGRTIYYWRTFPESNATPEYLPQLKEWARRFVDRYKQTVRAGDALNEPWEGGSLSGWHGTGAHYREILKSISQGAHEGDPTFTILANDAGMNVEDNILTAPGTIDLLDAVSLHTFRSYNAFVVPQYAAYGKKVWDTESWYGIGASTMVRQVVIELGQGLVKMQPVNTDSTFLAFKQPKEPKVSKRVTAPREAQAAPTPAYASPTAQAFSVLLHFIEDADFYREVSPESAPWMFVFKGRKNGPSPDKNVAVIAGRDNKWDNFPWRRVKSDGELTISDADNVLTAYDVKGNALPRAGGALHVPLTTDVYYVVSSKGADDLVARLQGAVIHGLEPVQLAVMDFTKPLSQKPSLRVKVTNVYNVPLSGSVEVQAPAGWQMSSTSKPFADLKAGETTELSFEVAKAQTLPGNRYPFTITAQTDKGSVKLSEQLSVAVLVKGTPPLEGTAADWQKLGAVPVYLTGGATAADSFLEYTMPFLNLKEEDDTAYFMQFMGMWDENNFYLLADINDATEKLRPSMEKGTWFTVHEPPNVFEYWAMSQAVPSTGGDMFNFCFNVLPYGQKQIANYPPASQMKLDPKWRVNVADYEYSLYLGKQNQVVPGDYQKAVAELKSARPAEVIAIRQPKMVEAGPPIPEVWRLMAPGLARNDYVPTSPRAPKDQGVVPGATLKVTREGNVYHYRAAIPWSELALIKPLALSGQSVNFSFLGKNEGRTAVSWSNEQRSIARCGQEIMHPTSEASWSPDTEWGFVDLAVAPKP